MSDVTIVAKAGKERLVLEVRGLELGEYTLLDFSEGWKQDLGNSGLNDKVLEFVLRAETVPGLVSLAIGGSTILAQGVGIGELASFAADTLEGRLVDKHPKPAKASLRSRLARW